MQFACPRSCARQLRSIACLAVFQHGCGRARDSLIRLQHSCPCGALPPPLLLWQPPLRPSGLRSTGRSTSDRDRATSELHVNDTISALSYGTLYTVNDLCYRSPSSSRRNSDSLSSEEGCCSDCGAESSRSKSCTRWRATGCAPIVIPSMVTGFDDGFPLDLS